MATRHSYASIDELRDYLAGTAYSSGWTSDTGILRRIIESASTRIDNYVGMQSFGPRTETHYFDIGSGSLRNTPQLLTPSTDDSQLGGQDFFINAIPLDSWLVSITSVTSYKQTERTSNETLTEGYNEDYWLEPYNTNPKTRLKLNEDTAKSFHSGQGTLAVEGGWGYANDLTAEKTTTGAITTDSEISWGVNDASELSIAQTILVGTEQMYITNISSNTLTVERGVNGTTASTHDAGTSVYGYEYSPVVVQACLDLAKVFFRDRDMGNTLTIGSGAEGITRSDADASSVLATLDEFRNITAYSEVYF